MLIEIGLKAISVTNTTMQCLAHGNSLL